MRDVGLPQTLLSVFRRVLGTRVSAVHAAVLAQSGAREAEVWLRRMLKEASYQNLWHAPLDALRYVVVDTETTGFDPRRDALIAVGAVEMVGAERTARTFHTLVRPDPPVPIPPHVVNLTGIRDADVATAPSLGEALRGFLAFARDGVLVMHHAGHDVRFLNAALQRRMGLMLPHWVVDTCTVARRLVELPAYRLDDVAAWYGIPVDGRHTALGDAAVTAELWRRQLDELRSRGITTLGRLYEAVWRTG